MTRMHQALHPPRGRDSALIFALVRELADYEKLSAEVDATEAADCRRAVCDEPRLSCDIAEWDGEPAGFAVWFLNFSTFRGRPGSISRIFSCGRTFRERGIGKALMARLAQRCVEEGYARFEWAVLDWNAPAIAFYKSIGAQVLDEWQICRLSGDALAKFRAAMGELRRMKIVLVAAVAENNVIGHDGQLPWRSAPISGISARSHWTSR